MILPGSSWNTLDAQFCQHGDCRTSAPSQPDQAVLQPMETRTNILALCKAAVGVCLTSELWLQEPRCCWWTTLDTFHCLLERELLGDYWWIVTLQGQLLAKALQITFHFAEVCICAVLLMVLGDCVQFMGHSCNQFVASVFSGRPTHLSYLNSQCILKGHRGQQPQRNWLATSPFAYWKGNCWGIIGE